MSCSLNYIATRRRRTLHDVWPCLKVLLFSLDNLEFVVCVFPQDILLYRCAHSVRVSFVYDNNAYLIALFANTRSLSYSQQASYLQSTPVGAGHALNFNKAQSLLQLSPLRLFVDDGDHTSTTHICFRVVQSQTYIIMICYRSIDFFKGGGGGVTRSQQVNTRKHTIRGLASSALGLL